jgi:tripartite-type tricarboxylate transporter receptor subunit TctC
VKEIVDAKRRTHGPQKRMSFKTFIVLLACLVCLPGQAQETAWPAKPIKLVVPYTPGGGTDILGRMLGRRLSEALGVAVVIENRPGSDGSIGTDVVAKAVPDGYTLLIDGTSQAYNVAFGKKMAYDSARDLAPVAQTANQQVLLLVNAKVPIQSVQQLIDYAHAHPGKLSYGASSNANALPMELFKILTKTDIVHVPYRGSGPMLNDLLGGQVELSMSGAAAPLPHVRAGSLRVLGIGDDQRSKSLPEFPTISESGVRGFQTLQWSGVYAPATTPKPIIGRLNREIDAIVKDPVFMKQMVDVGFDPVTGPNTPEVWGALVAGEVTKWSAIVKQAGLKTE